jgi:hypothetical protein
LAQHWPGWDQYVCDGFAARSIAADQTDAHNIERASFVAAREDRCPKIQDTMRWPRWCWRHFLGMSKCGRQCDDRDREFKSDFHSMAPFYLG